MIDYRFIDTHARNRFAVRFLLGRIHTVCRGIDREKECIGDRSDRCRRCEEAPQLDAIGQAEHGAHEAADDESESRLRMLVMALAVPSSGVGGH